MQTTFTWRGLSRVMLTGSILVGLGFGCGARTSMELESDVVATIECGNGVCGAGETCASCSADCGKCAGCGDGACKAEAGETCSTCPSDCGKCVSCGNGLCDAAETCDSCPGDCGSCDKCGDGFCSGAEDCLSCAPDCGACPSCGDKKCDPKTENCFTCPGDCGKCEGCGDGRCKPPETCASCRADCGDCSVCPNSKCEPPYETCSNCPEDCGRCASRGCLEVLTCSIKCFEAGIDGAPSLSCLAGCVASGCADVQFFVDQATSCMFRAFPKCRGSGSMFDCLQKACSAEFAACLGARCPTP